ncbi:MAG TPA: radical SAM protein [Acidobacteriaceae bacterium]|jgi:DNA repair photolyase|nr:radical SAM protein [Acidobacteriaceae bacterium]
MGEEKAKHHESPETSLFPILQPPPGGALTGIARLAGQATPAGGRHLIEFRSLEPRSLLNRTVSARMPWMSWTINPYRGCEFGCRYCYARYTHEFMERRDPELFEREIYIKRHAAWLLRQELKDVRPGEYIGLGTATDPYQPIERSAQVTRSILEVFAGHSGFRLGIVTKSTLIEGDIDLLTRIAARNQLTICLTITTPDAKLARILEPRAPRPDLRFRTVARLRAAGLRVGILCSPLMPGITDTARALDRMARRAKNAGASFFASQPLFLKSCSEPVFLRFIHEHFPELEASYAARYGGKAFVSTAYRERVAALVRAVIRKYDLDQRFSEDLPAGAEIPGPMQKELWPAAKKPPQRA